MQTIEQSELKIKHTPRSAHCLLLLLPKVEERSFLLLLLQIVDRAGVGSRTAFLDLREMRGEGVGHLQRGQEVERGVARAGVETRPGPGTCTSM